MGTPKFAGWFMSGKIPLKKMDDDWGLPPDRNHHMMVVCLKCLPPFSTTTPKRLQWIFLHHLLLGGRSSFGLHRRRLRWGGMVTSVWPCGGAGNLRGCAESSWIAKILGNSGMISIDFDVREFLMDLSFPYTESREKCNFPMLCSTLDLRSFEIRMALILRQI